MTDTALLMKSDRIAKKVTFQNEYITKNQSWRRKGLCYKIVFIVILLGSTLYFIDFSFLNISSQLDYYAKIIKRKHQHVMNEYFNNFDFSLNDEDDYEHYLVRTNGCKMAKFPIMSASIKKYFNTPDKIKPVTCTPPALTKSNSKHVWIIEDLDILKIFYNISEPKSLSCQFKSFERSTENDVTYSSHVHQVTFGEKVAVDAEFIKVICEHENFSDTYINYHSFVLIKPEVEARVQFIQRNASIVKWNIMVLGIDSVSKMNFQRLMKKSFSTLSKLSNVYEFYGFSKVADNTFPNLMPLLTGLSAEELNDVCEFANRTFDKCKFVWEDFKRAGYRTMFAEDTAWLGLFNYGKKGFTTQPTDYNWRSFILELEQIAYNKQTNYKLCMADRRPLDILFDYIKTFSTSMVDKKFFSFFWSSSMTHDYLNYPLLIDDDLNSLLLNLNKTYLKNTILFLMSDHGMRFGDFRNTYQGMVEERHPFLYIILPTKFLKSLHPAVVNNLKNNRRRLTTHFDLYATLKDLAELNYDSLSYDNIQSRTEEFSEGPYPRSISLFAPIPPKRTCENAGVPSHFCTCFEKREISTSDIHVQKAARFLVQSINILVEKQEQCKKLYLNSIESAYVDILDKNSFTNKQSVSIKTGKPVTEDIKQVTYHDIYVKITTKPGQGEFEATLRYYPETENLQLTASISRTNLYGSSSYCVKDATLKLYCYCDH